MLLGNNYSKTYCQSFFKTVSMNSLVSNNVLIFIPTKQNALLPGWRCVKSCSLTENRQVGPRRDIQITKVWCETFSSVKDWVNWEMLCTSLGIWGCLLAPWSNSHAHPFTELYTRINSLLNPSCDCQLLWLHVKKTIIYSPRASSCCIPSVHTEHCTAGTNATALLQDSLRRILKSFYLILRHSICLRLWHFLTYHFIGLWFVLEKINTIVLNIGWVLSGWDRKSVV